MKKVASDTLGAPELPRPAEPLVAVVAPFVTSTGRATPSEIVAGSELGAAAGDARAVQRSKTPETGCICPTEGLQEGGCCGECERENGCRGYLSDCKGRPKRERHPADRWSGNR